ncbi:MAG: cation:dicarboxylase symporter family transporter [Bacteroides graminisolvens]
MLQLIAVPLVLVSLIKGVTALKHIRRFSQIGLKALLIYMSTTVCAISGTSFGAVSKAG